MTDLNDDLWELVAEEQANVEHENNVAIIRQMLETSLLSTRLGELLNRLSNDDINIRPNLDTDNVD